MTLLHVRLGRPVSFGGKHWILWAPSLVLVIMSTALSGVISGAGVNSLFYGLIAYSSTVMVATAVAFSCIIGTLFAIKRNLTAINEEMDPWPPAVRQIENKSRPSFATEDIDAMREGGSWVSSNSSSSSRHNSISAWSFSTHHTVNASSPGHGRPQSGGRPSIPTKSPYWFGAASRENIPPVPPLPSQYSQISPTAESLADPDPFRRNTPSPIPEHPRARLDSQTSWLTSTDGSHTTLSAWSFPATRRESSSYSPSVRDVHTPSTLVSRSNTPALSSAQVLGGYGYSPSGTEKGVCPAVAAPGISLDVSVTRNLGWYLFILLPYVSPFHLLKHGLETYVLFCRPCRCHTLSLSLRIFLRPWLSLSFSCYRLHCPLPSWLSTLCSNARSPFQPAFSTFPPIFLLISTDLRRA